MRPVLGVDVTSDALLIAGPWFDYETAGHYLCVITDDKELYLCCLFVLIVLIEMIVVRIVSTAMT